MLQISVNQHVSRWTASRQGINFVICPQLLAFIFKAWEPRIRILVFLIPGLLEWSPRASRSPSVQWILPLPVHACRARVIN